MRKGLVGLVVVLGLLGSRCSEPTKTEEPIPEAPAIIVVAGPTSVNAPPQISQKAWELNSYFTSILNLLGDLGNTNPEINGNIYTWEIAFGSGTVMKSVKAVRRSDKSIDWTVTLNGQSEDSTLYSDRKVFIGKSAADNSSQSWSFYDLLTGDITHKIAWSKDKNGTLQLDDTYATMNAVWHLTNATDGTGSYRYTVAGTTRFEAAWRTNGSGTFTDYTVPGAPQESWE
jgi:hypothetical protein